MELGAAGHPGSAMRFGFAGTRPGGRVTFLLRGKKVTKRVCQTRRPAAPALRAPLAPDHRPGRPLNSLRSDNAAGNPGPAVLRSAGQRGQPLSVCYFRAERYGRPMPGLTCGPQQFAPLLFDVSRHESEAKSPRGSVIEKYYPPMYPLQLVSVLQTRRSRNRVQRKLKGILMKALATPLAGGKMSGSVVSTVHPNYPNLT